MARVGMEDCFGTSGKAGDLLNYYNLNAAGIVAKVKSLL